MTRKTQLNLDTQPSEMDNMTNHTDLDLNLVDDAASPTDTVRVAAEPEADLAADSTPSADATPASTPTPHHAPVPAPTPNPTERVKHGRSQRYVQARSLVDKTREFSPEEAIELLKRTAYGRFDGTVTVHINLKKEIKPVDVVLPYSTGKQVRVAIVSDSLIEDIKAGQLEFDVLLAHPKFMPKLVPLARVLGPKGLMPNPKNGTVTTDPDAKKAELEKGAIQVKTEKKAPLVHQRLGKVSQASEELAANLRAVILAVRTNNIAKVCVAPTMGPSVKVAFANIE